MAILNLDCIFKSLGAALNLPYRKGRLPRSAARPVDGVLLHLPLLQHRRHGQLRLGRLVQRPLRAGEPKVGVAHGQVQAVGSLVLLLGLLLDLLQLVGRLGHRLLELFTGWIFEVNIKS